MQGADALSVPVYDAFSAMLRVTTSLVLKLHPFDDADSDQRLVDSRNQMLIEQSLDAVGRRRLLSSKQATIEERVDALDELNSYSIDLTTMVLRSKYSTLPKMTLGSKIDRHRLKI